MKKILTASVLSLLLFSNAPRSEAYNSINEYSLYTYNALESRGSFAILENNTKTQTGGKPQDGETLNDISKELENITEKQNSMLEKTEGAMDALKSNNELKTLLIGSNVGILRFQLVQIKDLISELQALSLKAILTKDRTQIGDHIKTLKEQQAKVENFIGEEDNRFSFFGWFVKML